MWPLRGSFVSSGGSPSGRNSEAYCATSNQSATACIVGRKTLLFHQPLPDSAPKHQASDFHEDRGGQHDPDQCGTDSKRNTSANLAEK